MPSFPTRFTSTALRLALLATLALPAFTPARTYAAEVPTPPPTAAAPAPAQEAPRPRLFLPFLSGGSGTPRVWAELPVAR